MIKKYHAIIFDADETLFHFNAIKGLNLMFQRLGIAFTEADYLSFQKNNKAMWQKYQQGHLTLEQIRDKRFTPWSFQTQKSSAELNHYYMQIMTEISETVAGAEALIHALFGKVKLLLMTNGFTQMQAPRLERHDLAKHFDFIITSEEVGVPKPHRKIFDVALERLGDVQPEQVLMIGDTLEADILGGSLAQLDTCWFNPANKPTHSSIKPTYQVDCLVQLRHRLSGGTFS